VLVLLDQASIVLSDQVPNQLRRSGHGCGCRGRTRLEKRFAGFR
jgi:hypothetical protein